MDLNSAVRKPPPGHVSNLEHPPNEAGLAYATLGISLVTVTLFTWFRFLVKLWIMQKLHLEDCEYFAVWCRNTRSLMRCRSNTVRLGMQTFHNTGLP